MDSDYKTLSEVKPKTYEAISSNGLEYVVSSVTPGRNRIVHKENNCVVINQSARNICGLALCPGNHGRRSEREQSGAARLDNWYTRCPGNFLQRLYLAARARFMEMVDYLTKATTS